MGNKVKLTEFVHISLQLISLRRIMAFVCLAGKAEKNKNVEFGVKTKGCAGNLKKIKSFINRKVDCYSNSRTIDHGKNRKKQVSDFRSEYNLATTSATRGKQVSRTSFLLGVAGEKAVEILDTLGSSMPKLSTSNGFVSGLAPRGNKISILAFEVANTINKGAILFQSLSEENIECLKNEILQTEGMKQLVSTDTKELISFIEADKREEVNAFSREVARFGNMCKHPQWHNLDRYFSELDSGVLDIKQPRIEAEKTMQELITLAKNTAELYHELNSFDRFEQNYQQKVKEMESLNLPLKGESLTVFISELKNQRKRVKSMKKKSLWCRRLEEIVEKLLDVVTYIHQAISEFLGNYVQLQPENSKGSHRLGEYGLALHYANIINQINMIASRPTGLPPNTRDTLYHGLPRNIKSALPSRLKNNDATKELSFPQVKAKMDKTLQWLAQFATNTTKAHQGFGWVGEWANTSNNSGCNTTKERNPIRLQTLHYADKQKVDFYILELLAQLHHLVSFVRYKHNNNYPMKPMPSSSSSHKGLDSLDFKSKMLQLISLDNRVTQISQEDRTLLEEVVSRRRTLGLSKSEDLAVTKKKEARVWCFNKSVGSSPVTRMGLENQNSNVLDIMDGLGY